MHCEKSEALLPLLALDDLDAGRKAELEAHLLECGACRGKLADLRETLRLLNEAAAQLPAAKLSAEQREALTSASVGEETKQPKVRFIGRVDGALFAIRRKWATIAAACLLCLVMGLLVLPALAPAREQARSAQRREDARQWGLGTQLSKEAPASAGSKAGDQLSLGSENKAPEYLPSSQFVATSARDRGSLAGRMPNAPAAAPVDASGRGLALPAESPAREKATALYFDGRVRRNAQNFASNEPDSRGGLSYTKGEKKEALALNGSLAPAAQAPIILSERFGEVVTDADAAQLVKGGSGGGYSADTAKRDEFLFNKDGKEALEKAASPAAAGYFFGAAGPPGADYLDLQRAGTLKAGASAPDAARQIMAGMPVMAEKPVARRVAGRANVLDVTATEAAKQVRDEERKAKQSEPASPDEARFGLSSDMLSVHAEAARKMLAMGESEPVQPKTEYMWWRADSDAAMWDAGNKPATIQSATTTTVPLATSPSPVSPPPMREAMPPPVFRAGPVNPWVMTEKDALSTFALDVDTASFVIARNYIARGSLPPAASVRMEEFVNAFDYNYPVRATGVFNTHAEAGPSPFRPALTLLKVGVRARVLGREARKPAHLVFVVDASGSMDRPDRMPLVKYALRELVGQLGPQDRVSLVSFGMHAMLMLETVPASDKKRIMEAVDGIRCGGSTNLFEGLKLGYELAVRSFQPGAINRVILCSDGVANIGNTEADAMLEDVASLREQGVALTTAGFGYGAYDDALLERLADRGDGNYVFVDSESEARRVFVEEMSGTLQTVAKDAKIQVAFDPAAVRRYRLIGFENRAIADKDFRNDAVDAGEVGSGQSSTALYELELIPPAEGVEGARDLGTVYVRYRNVETGKVEEISQRLGMDIVRRRSPADSPRFFLAACVAEFAEILRGSEHAKGDAIAPARSMLEQVAAQLPLDARVQDLLTMMRAAEGLPRAE